MAFELKVLAFEAVTKMYPASIRSLANRGINIETVRELYFIQNFCFPTKM